MKVKDDDIVQGGPTWEVDLRSELRGCLYLRAEVMCFLMALQHKCPDSWETSAYAAASLANKSINEQNPTDQPRGARHTTGMSAAQLSEPQQEPFLALSWSRIEPTKKKKKKIAGKN